MYVCVYMCAYMCLSLSLSKATAPVCATIGVALPWVFAPAYKSPSPSQEGQLALPKVIPCPWENPSEDRNTYKNRDRLVRHKLKKQTLLPGMPYTEIM